MKDGQLVERGLYKCAKGGAGVAVTNPRDGETEKELAEEALKAALETQRACHILHGEECLDSCQVRRLIVNLQTKEINLQ